VLADLHVAYDRHSLDVAGPTVAFDPEAALWAALTLANACWALVGSDRMERLEVPVSPAAKTAATHLSADVVLRFLPAVYRRAIARGPESGLTTDLARLLRAWPLSGVLADLDGEPSATPEFGGHPGLQMLYAERLVVTGRAGWLPVNGTAREWVDRVFEERGRPVPAPLPKEEPRA